ncbi:hypothetical protein ACKWTF_004874 [Chironomus riparius]
MNIEDEDLGSDSDSDDGDYCPVNDSGSESIDEKEDLNENNEGTTNPTKKKRRKGRRTRNKQVDDENEEEERQTIKTVQDPEKEKERVDALWADFLSGTEIPLEKKETTSTKSSTSKTDIPKIQKLKPAPAPKVFEFAGETIEVSQNDTENSTSSINPIKPSTGQTNSLGIKRPSAGGLSSVLDQFSKKNKLSVLEKTKLDWDGFKSKEGINEELKTHNRGRQGFLERRDFLERTDFRQFEIEKSLRTTSKRKTNEK